MNRSIRRLGAAALGLVVAGFAVPLGAIGPTGAGAFALAQTGPPVPEPVQKIFHRSCGVVGCHQGRFPKMALNLETPEGTAGTIGASSTERPELKLVEPGDPEKSYILLKIRGDRSVSGSRMPKSRDPLRPEEIQAVRDWITALKKGEQDSDQDAAPKDLVRRPLFPVPAFWGIRLVNLPTAQPIDKGHLLFRVSHRFFEPIGSGTPTFFGLDSGAHILLGFGYGISDNLGIFLSRSNVDQDVELGLSWLAFSQGGPGRLPFSAAVHLSGNLTTLARDGRALFDASNLGINAAVSLVHQLSPRVSLLLVPAYASNSSHGDPSIRGTLSLGLGGRVMVFEDISLIAEWIPVLSGFKGAADGWGLGIEKKIGGHVFQAFILNSHGLTTDQVLPGGDLRSGVRLGFNIFRTF